MSDFENNYDVLQGRSTRKVAGFLTQLIFHPERFCKTIGCAQCDEDCLAEGVETKVCKGRVIDWLEAEYDAKDDIWQHLDEEVWIKSFESNEWNDPKEELPKHQENVLATVKVDGLTRVVPLAFIYSIKHDCPKNEPGFWAKVDTYYKNYYGDIIQNHSYFDGEVIAWRPMPEPVDEDWMNG